MNTVHSHDKFVLRAAQTLTKNIKKEWGSVSKKRKMSFTTVGGSSILTIFAVLCFIVFALLSLSTAKADSDLAERSVYAVSEYYEADAEAENILAELRKGELPEGVTDEGGGKFSYACPIDDNQKLMVTVQLSGNSYKILRWQKEYTGEWKSDDTIEVWGGGTEITK